MTNFFRQFEEDLATLPGIRAETVSNIGIIGDGQSGATLHVLGRPQEKEPARVQTNAVGADFFETLGIPILQGRAFNRHDTSTSPRVAIVNHALAQQFFPNENPIGKTFETDPEDVEGSIQIVGVAADTRYADLRSETPPIFYVPYVQEVIGPSRMMVEIRTVGNPGPCRVPTEIQLAGLARQTGNGACIRADGRY
jgi:hypothetical protein